MNELTLLMLTPEEVMRVRPYNSSRFSELVPLYQEYLSCEFGMPWKGWTPLARREGNQWQIKLAIDINNEQLEEYIQKARPLLDLVAADGSGDRLIDLLWCGDRISYLNLGPVGDPESLCIVQYTTLALHIEQIPGGKKLLKDSIEEIRRALKWKD